MKKIFAALVFSFLLLPMMSSAAEECTSNANCPTPTGRPYCCAGRCQAEECTPVDPQDPVTASNDPFGFGSKLDTVAGDFKTSSPQTVEEKVASFIAIFLSFLGVIFLILMIWAGFNWMVAAGDEEKITKSKETIKAAVIGLVIVIAAYALSVFIIERLWGAAS